MLKHTFSSATKRMTVEEWQAEAKRRFGENSADWKFICPVCGHVQSVDDFRQYKDRGATPDSACQECIGRYMFGKNKPGGPNKPCDYAIYGLFCLPGILVVYPDGHERPVFGFADGSART